MLDPRSADPLPAHEGKGGPIVRGWKSWTHWERRTVIVLFVLGISASAGFLVGSGGPDAVMDDADDASVSGLTRDQVVIFAGREPERCHFAAPDREICVWKLAGRLFGPDVPAAGGKGVNLVCELPIDVFEAEPGTCAAYVRETGVALADGLPPVSASPPAIADQAQPKASEVLRRLADAGRIRELSDLVGDAPRACRTGLGVQTCSWRISEWAPSYALFDVAAAGEGTLELTCLLPIDGEVREANSCSVSRIDMHP